MLVRLERLLEPFAFARLGNRSATQSSRLDEHAPNTGRAGGDDVPIVHHPGQTAIPFSLIFVVKLDDLGFFSGQKPAILGYSGIMTIGFPDSVEPAIILASVEL